LETSTPPLRQQAFEQIRERLLVEGPNAYGERLTEQELARQLAMSRTPVREALQQLAAAGLVERGPKGGYAPSRPRLRDVNEEYDLRLLLESRAAALAATSSCSWGTQSVGDAGGSAFHLAVAHAAGHRALASSIAVVWESSVTHRLRLVQGEADERLLRDGHRAIAAAVAAQDAIAAERAMRDHLAVARDLALAALGAERERRVR
jgi:DNA-binding GntR family transcriptional regulator